MQDTPSPASPGVFAAVRKIVEGPALSDQECESLCRIVFFPVVAHRYNWIGNKIAGESGLGSRQRESDSRDRLNDPVFQNAIAHLWNELSTKAVWAKALKKCMDADSAVREKQLIYYLKACAARELVAWCGKDSNYRAIARLAVAGAKQAGYVRYEIRGRRYVYALTPPTVNPHCAANVQAIIEECAQRNIHIPAPRGKSKFSETVLPTPEQICGVLVEINPAPLVHFTAKDLVNLVKELWQISDNRPESLDGSPTDDDGRDTPDEQTPLPDTREDLEECVDLIVRAVEEIDGCPIDPPPEDRSIGKLGRLFTEYAIWFKLPAAGSTSGAYVIEQYSAHSGYGRGTENDRMNKVLLPVLKGRVPDNDQFVDLLELLRQRFIHRKPEFVEYPSLSTSGRSKRSTNQHNALES